MYEKSIELDFRSRRVKVFKLPFEPKAHLIYSIEKKGTTSESYLGGEIPKWI